MVHNVVASVFAGISILSNKLTGISGKHNIINFALCTRAPFYHFPDVGKMVKIIQEYIYLAGFIE
jgi:hypothetical protein